MTNYKNRKIMQYSDFSNIYSQSITLRFGLIPQGETLQHIQENGLLEQDARRAEDYVKVKKLIDEYHKTFIERVLKGFKLKVDEDGGKDSLEEYFLYYNKGKKEDKQIATFEKVQENLRKSIADRLAKDTNFSRINKKELIKEDLLNTDLMRQLTEEEQALVKEFSDFTTYFTGFNQNRQNMYSAEKKSTAISYRLIHENLPKFIDNMKTFDIVANSEVAVQFDNLYQKMETYLNVEKLSEMFCLSYFNVVLTQTQIEVYNAIIGGKSLDDGSRIQGLNELVNLYNQKHKDAKLPKFKLLYKQILSDREAVSWLPEKFEKDNELLSSIQKAYQELSGIILGDSNLKNLLLNIASYDLNRIYISNDTQFTQISQRLFKDWGALHRVILEDLKSTVARGKKESESDYLDRLDKLVKKSESYSIGYLNQCIDKSELPDKPHVETYFTSLGAVHEETEQCANLFTQISIYYMEAQKLLTQEYPTQSNLAQDKQAVDKIKNLLDALKSLQHFVKPLLGNGDEPDKEERFYGELDSLWQEMEQITPLYNKVRNYLTRKPYSTGKIKLNFENSTLMDGWDLNKEPDNTTVILRKDGLYYLAIMNKAYNRVFKADILPDNGECFEKMEYKLLPGANKMLPKVFFSKSRIKEFAPSEKLLQHYADGTHKKGPNFSKADCHELIDFFKASIQKHEDWSKFNFQFSDTSTYEDLSGFYREVEQQGFKISFRSVSVSYVKKLVEEGKIYLFQIYNKDFSPSSKGKPNLHTLYWRMVFDERNLKDVVYKLNGQAEVFFRQASLTNDLTVHPAHQPIANKNPNNPKKTSTFEYDLIKNRRYTVDHFQFHVPITMNFKATGNSMINPQVYQYLKETKDTYVIGIDRGERHLLYLTLIDPQGRIVKQCSLNEMVNEYQNVVRKTNYHDLLDAREAERKQARQSWMTIENIKELKEGYLSQVVHLISQMMVKYKAIVVMEDLNMGFKRGRQKVEKQVYQKFEKMLIDKLNYLVDKDTDAEAAGGLLHAYQLTNKFESFQRMGKQSGFLFYVPAWNTSKMDPTTGFVNLLDTRYESVASSLSFFRRFKQIRYNEDKDWFEFKLDYNDFDKRAEGTRTEWMLCTQGERIITFRNKAKNSEWDSKSVRLTEEFKKFFYQYDVDIHGNLMDTILERTDKSFFEGLYALLKLTLQMRNSITGTDVDYLISPVMNAKGTFYDSRQSGSQLPENADANGAYNIALKGLWVLKQIWESKELKEVKLAITNKEWLQFAQEKPFLKY
jgi:CRISPR-associated protein Cpf1